MPSVANIVRFLPAAGSTGDFVYSSGVTGYRTPVSSPALTDGATYRYRAEIADLSEWEIGEGTWATSTTTLARTTIIHSSTGSKVSFSSAPNVAIVALADQFINPAGDTMTGSLVVPNASGIKIKDTDASHTLGIVGGSNLTADRTLTVTTGDANRTLDLSATTGTGNLVFATAPVLTTPVLGAATATTIDAPNKGNRFGTASGAGVRAAPAVTDANIQLYQLSSVNWAGFVIDSNGAFGIRVGLSGTPDCAFNILTDGKVGVGTVSPAYAFDAPVAARIGSLNLTTQLGVAYGGTGATTLAANNVLLGNGTGALQEVAPGTTGNVLTSNGTAWTSAAPAASGGKAADQQVFTSSGTWTKPSGFSAKAMAFIQKWGAGGGGGRSASANQAGGGGGGGYVERWILLSSLGATETVTIGAGGAGRSGSAGSGTAGGNTTFGALGTAYGGGGGGLNSPGAGGSGASAGGTASATIPILVGIDGSAVISVAATIQVPHPHMGGAGKHSSSTTYYAAANAVYGGGGGGGNGQTGGTSQFGGAGGNSAATPTAGAQPGGGGGGSSSANADGAAGAAGKVIVTVFDGA